MGRASFDEGVRAAGAVEGLGMACVLSSKIAARCGSHGFLLAAYLSCNNGYSGMDEWPVICDLFFCHIGVVQYLSSAHLFLLGGELWLGLSLSLFCLLTVIKVARDRPRPREGDVARAGCV